MVDATLLVASLSDIFTQDLEDMDLDGLQVSTQRKYYTDQDGVISTAQAKRMFALAQGDQDLVRQVLEKYGYGSSKEVKKTDYEKICLELEAESSKAN